LYNGWQLNTVRHLNQALFSIEIYVREVEMYISMKNIGWNFKRGGREIQER
jgi:hypothetical protein